MNIYFSSHFSQPTYRTELTASINMENADLYLQHLYAIGGKTLYRWKVRAEMWVVLMGYLLFPEQRLYAPKILLPLKEIAADST